MCYVAQKAPVWAAHNPLKYLGCSSIGERHTRAARDGFHFSFDGAEIHLLGGMIPGGTLLISHRVSPLKS